MKKFSKVVQEFLNVEAYEQMKRYKILAEQFEVAETTINKWILDTARPHPKIQKLIIDFIEKELR